MVITAFIPSLGYERALELVEEFRKSGETDIRAFLKTRLDPELVENVLRPQNLVALGYR
jgi:aspartate ammonia-lyase